MVHIFDRDKALLALRTFRHREMGADYMLELMQCVDKLATSCGITEPRNAHSRGWFAQMRIGWSHGMGEGENVSSLPTFFSLRMDVKLFFRCHTA